MISDTSYPEILLQEDCQLHRDADKRNTSLQLGSVELTKMKMQGVPYKLTASANTNSYKTSKVTPSSYAVSPKYAY
jgi:hypothetical protein